MVNSTFKEQMEKLYRLRTSTQGKSSLKTMQVLDQTLGFPSKHTPFIHVAGTNGKGSVCYKVYQALLQTSHKVGLFSSPHFFSYCERIRIGDAMVSESFVLRGLERIFLAAEEKGLTPTFFEVTTMLAFLAFQEYNVDLAILEVGIGGRLDATNIVNPLVTAITSISFDHCEILGNTLGKIAFEKAGIIKENVPIITTNAVPSVIALEAKKKQASYIEVPVDQESANTTNTIIALAIIQELNKKGFSVSTSFDDLKKVRPFGRLNKQQILYEGQFQEFLFDCAHNVASFQELIKHAKMDAVFILSFSEGKDVHSILDLLKKSKKCVFLTPGSHPRLMKQQALKEYTQNESMISASENISEALQKACEMKPVQIVISGSFYFVSEVYKQVGLKG